MKRCFITQFTDVVLQATGLSTTAFSAHLQTQISSISNRGDAEKQYWQTEMEKIRHYSREKAIEELIKAKKIQEKITQIEMYIKGLEK